jgi:predicted nucleotidyltransferase
MNTTMLNLEAMQELKALLLKTFPNEFEQVIVFGSQVTGQATEDSDYDVLVIVNHDYDWRFKHQIYDVTWEIDFKHDILTDVKIISLPELQTLRGKQPFIQNALHTGIVL